MMENLEILRTGFVAFLDGLWWGLRDSTGALSMYDGYAGGFREIGKEIAKTSDEKGPEGATKVAADIFKAIGLEIEVDKTKIIVKSCPIWNRILNRGLEYSFHVETICWKPMFEGIGEIMHASPEVKSSLRLAYIAKSKAEYKKKKAKAQLDGNTITQAEYSKLVQDVDAALNKQSKFGEYSFK